MFRYRKILVALDGSPSSDNALRQAFRLAEHEKGWITAVTVIPSYDGDLDITGIDDIHARLRRPGETILARASAIARVEGYLITTVLEEGVTHQRILELAETHECCGVIVMGRRGRSRIDRSLVGSTTARVIGHSSKDVLVVPDRASPGWDRILVAVDGSNQSRKAADKAIGLAASYGSELKIVSAVDIPAEFYGEAPDVVDRMVEQTKSLVADLKTRAGDAGIVPTTAVHVGEAHSVITATADKEKFNLIVIGSIGRTGIRRLLMGRVAEKVIGYAPCPVLVVNS